jgi:hypothetical protein
MTKINPDSLIGMPMFGCVSPSQLAEILETLAEYPDATDCEIRDVTGHPAYLVAAVRKGYSQ